MRSLSANRNFFLHVRLQQWLLTVGLLAVFCVAQAQTVSISMPVAVTYQAGGQNLVVMSFTKTGAGVLSAPLTLNFTPTQIANQSWAVQNSLLGTTFTPAGIPNGIGNLSFTVNFPTATPATVIIRLEIRNKFAATGAYSLTASSGAVTASTTFNPGAPAKTQCTIPGKDGTPPVFTTQEGVVNTYFGVPMDATLRTVAAGAHCLPIDVNNVAGANPGTISRLDDIAKGDLLLIYQTQGADIDASDSTNYGDGATPGGGDTVGGNVGGVTSLRQSGIYEFVLADGAVNTPGADVRSNCAAGAGTAANPDVLPIAGTEALGGLVNSYERQEDVANSVRRNYQIIRVPQYVSVVFSGIGSIAALAWNGTIGGILSVDVAGTINLGSGAASDKRFVADGRGFRGGAARVATGSGVSSTAFRSVSGALPNDAHGIKGESIAGTPSFVFDGTSNVATGFDYINGSNGRGAPGNGGGGGNACTASSNSEVSGGAGGANHGQGGNGGNCADPFNLITDASLGGRRSSGLATSGLRMFFGGGGGAGVKTVASGANDATGGTGGGIIFIRANTINGIGAITANATNGRSGSTLVNESGGGGGGAGGTLIVMANIGGGNIFTNTLITANGGAGGDAAAAAPVNTLNNTGPGGGGGGGRFFSTNLDNQLDGVIQTASGGRGGTTVGLLDFGANAGDVGAQNTALNSFTFAPGPRPGYICSGSTVAVTLSSVIVTESGPDLVVNFNTATEAGTLGFRVLVDIGRGIQARVEIASVASKTIDSLKEQAYTVRAPNPGANQIWIEEFSVDGKSVQYGPYEVGSLVGEVGLATPLNWAAVNAEQIAFRTTRALALRGVSAQSSELTIATDSWVRVTHEQLLAAGVNLAGQARNNIAVRLGSQTVAARVNTGGKSFGVGSSIEFYAKAVENNLYTNTAVYRIEIGRALTMNEIDARSTGLSVGPEVQAVADTLLLNSNTAYSFSSPLEDPWYSFRALRSGGAAVGIGSINFTLKDRIAPPVGDGLTKPGVVNVEPESIEVSFWGGLDYVGAAPDHLAVFKLNGALLGQTQFDGFTARIERFAVPAGLLLNGTNTLTVELPNSTGYAADIVNVESVSVGYTRKLNPQADRFSVVLPATPVDAAKESDANKVSKGAEQLSASTFVITGLSGAPVVAVLERAGKASVLATDAISGGSLRIELQAQAGDRLSLMPIENDLTPSAAQALEDPIAGASASYLIISHPSFIASLTPLILAKQQQGFSVKVVDVEAIYRYYSAGVIDPTAIQLAIRRAQQSLNTTHVLLVGGDTYDYHNVLGVNSVSFIPTNYRRIGPIIAFAPSDAVYADTDGNGVPNIAIGRLPVRTSAELNALLAKSLSYQNTHKALFISDRSLNGLSYASQAAPLANLLGGDWTSSQLSLDSFASGQAATARAAILSNLEGGTSLLSYFGHSAPASWSREGLITASQVSGGLFNTVNQPFAVVQLGCWGTYFVEPTSTTVAHQMLLMQKGAAAVLGTSSLTQSDHDIALANQLLPRLNSANLGDALLQAQQALGTELPEAKDVILGGTLLGDPALR